MNTASSTLSLLLDNTPSLDDPLSKRQIARLLGFTDEESIMMERYTTEEFNTSWIYLSDVLIVSFLTNDTSKDKLAHFYSRVLCKENGMFTEGIDYARVEFEHPLVQHGLSLEGKLTRVGNKKYYMVTGECFKMLLISANTTAGRSHLRYFMRLTSMEAVTQRYQDHMTMRKRVHDASKHSLSNLPPIRGYIYMMRSRVEGRHDMVKIGRSIHPERRLAQFRTADPTMYIYKTFHVLDMPAAERALHCLFAGSRVYKNREWFYLFNSMDEMAAKLMEAMAPPNQADETIDMEEVIDDDDIISVGMASLGLDDVDPLPEGEEQPETDARDSPHKNGELLDLLERLATHKGSITVNISRNMTFAR